MNPDNSNMIETIKTFRVANGHVVQIKCVGIETETTFVVSNTQTLEDSIPAFVKQVLESKL